MNFIMINQVQAINTDKLSDEAYKHALRIGFDEILSSNRVPKNIKAEIEAAKFVPKFSDQ